MIYAIVIGVATGLFFGEMAAWVGVIGEVFVLLIQMTVYPYIVTTLIAGMASLQADNAKRLFLVSALVYLAMLLLGLVVILSSGLSFPDREKAVFFSTSVVTPPPPVNYLKLFIPSNPFASLADGAVPAIVLFCFAFGLALRRVKAREASIAFFDTASACLADITSAMMKIFPLGIFGMSAGAAATMTFEQFSYLQSYLVTYCCLSLLFIYAIFPIIIHFLTPIGWREFIREMHGAIITAFITANVIIVLPVITESLKKLLRKYSADKNVDSAVGILVPLVYSFPNMGKFMVMIFITFAAWFSDRPLQLNEYFNLASSGSLTLFGSVFVAIPFMLDLLQISRDLTELFIVASFISSRFTSAVTVAYMFAIVLVIVVVLQRKSSKSLRFKTIRRFSMGAAAILAATALTQGLGYRVNDMLVVDYPTTATLDRMHMETRIPEQVSRSIPTRYETGDHNATNVELIRRRGFLRIGYYPDSIPFSYFNGRGELVGFDIAMIHALAETIGVGVKFMPYRRDNLALALNRGYFDIAVSGIVMDGENIERVAFTRPVMLTNLAFLTEDFRLAKFRSVESIRKLKGVSIAYLQHSKILAEMIARNLPAIAMHEVADYSAYTDNPEAFDALLISAEVGYAIAILQPEYGVVVPKGQNIKFPLAYAVAKRNTDLREYLNNWLVIQELEQLQNVHYQDWILGQASKDEAPRWSVIRNVLGWVD